MKFLTVIALLFLSCAADARPNSIFITADDRAAFFRGVRMQRMIDIFQSPRACGIVLLRPRCVSDLGLNPINSVGMKIGSLLGGIDLSFASSGDVSTFPSQLLEANTVGLTSKLPWSKDPRSAWLQVAGSAYVMSLGESDMIHQLYSSDLIGALVQHASQAGPYAQLIPAKYVIAAHRRMQASPQKPSKIKMAVSNSPVQIDDIPKLQNLVVRNFQTRFPIEAQPAFQWEDGVFGDARIGIYMATFNELGESPMVLMEPQTRAFIASLIRFELSHGATTGKVNENLLLSNILNARSEGDLKTTFQTVQTVVFPSYLRTLSENRRKNVVYAMYIAQGAYNAAALQDKQFDTSIRSMLQPDSGFDIEIPGFLNARQAFLATTSTDWKAENAALSAIVKVLAE